MPITTHKGTTPAERAAACAETARSLAGKPDMLEGFVSGAIQAAYASGERSGAIEALKKAQILACYRCASNVPLLNERVHAGRWPCGAIEVRRLLEEYGTKPTAEGTR
jgi:hypothetical protein